MQTKPNLTKHSYHALSQDAPPEQLDQDIKDRIEACELRQKILEQGMLEDEETTIRTTQS